MDRCAQALSSAEHHRRRPVPNNLKPAPRRCLRLKRMVKRRHNTISDSEVVTLADRKRQEKVRSKHRLLSNRVFKSYDDIVDHCCYAWNTLIDQPWKSVFIAHGDWAVVGHSL